MSAVENHFTDHEHGPDDLVLSIIDCIPPNFSPEPACVHSERVRMESVWIARLQTQWPLGLNMKKQPRFSFTGYSAASDDRHPTEA